MLFLSEPFFLCKRGTFMVHNTMIKLLYEILAKINADA
jgi:hypothetical protein